MKNNKLHKFPLQTTFLKRIQAGVQYFNQNYSLNFDVDSLEVKFSPYLDKNERRTDSIFEKALKTLNLHNPKYLTKLKITVEVSFIFRMSTTHQFGLSLFRHFKKLKQLELRFLSCHGLNRGNMKHLLVSLTAGMECLTEVSIYFLACRDLDDQCLYDLKSSIVKRCKRLQKFKILINSKIVDHWDKSPLYFEPDLDERFRNEHMIAGGERYDSENKTTRKGGNSLCRSIAQYLGKLRSFTFKMTTSNDEEDMKLTEAIFQMISWLKNLEHLNFSVPDDLEVDDEYLAKLFSCIGQNLTKLRSLSLDFPNNAKISEKGSQLLAQNLFSILPLQLTYFAFNLEDCHSITDDIIIGIGCSIANSFKNLQTLILSFHAIPKLTGNALSGFTHVISKGLPSLKKLILSFAYCWGVNQSFPIVLPQQIRQFGLYLFRPPSMMIHKTWENLNRLSLSFNSCQEQKNFVDLSSGSFKNLKELTLLYTRCENIEDTQIKELALVIGTKFQNLTSLVLGFSGCRFLTSDSLLFLSDNICKKLNKLCHLNLTFTSYDDYLKTSFTGYAIIYLISEIKSRLENLESLTLNFYESVVKGTNMEEMLHVLCFSISQSLKKLKKLTLIFEILDYPNLEYQMRKQLCQIPMLYIR